MVNSSAPLKSTQQNSRLFWGILVFALVVARIIGSQVLPIYDDAFITYRYARNLAGGQGFVYQPGEWVLGATCPGFGVLVALFYRLGLPMPAFVIGMNIVCDALTLLLISRILLLKERDHNTGAAPLALWPLAFLFALSPILTRICVGGMEMNLFLLASLSAILLFHRDFKIPAVILAACCYFLRPEGVLLIAILCGLELWETRRFSALRLPLVALAILTAPILLIFHFYGHILPQSVMAKSHVVNRSVLTTAKSLVAPDAVALLVLPFALWGVVCLFREKFWRQNSVFRTLALWYAVYLAAYLVARPHIWSWYSAPIQFVQLVFAALGVANLLAHWPIMQKAFARENSPPWKLGITSSALAVGFWLLLLLKSGPSGTTRFVYAPLQSWSQSHLSARDSILAEDIGAVGYYSNARIYDAAGLIWPAALNYNAAAAIIKDRRPNYLFLNADRQRMEMMDSNGFNALYQPMQRFSINHETNMKSDPKLYPATWTQDYILFQRRAGK